MSRLIAEADSGRVGEVRMVSIREHRFPFLKKVGDWNRLKRNTGDTLVEKCCHFFGEEQACEFFVYLAKCLKILTLNWPNLAKVRPYFG